MKARSRMGGLLGLSGLVLLLAGGVLACAPIRTGATLSLVFAASPQAAARSGSAARTLVPESASIHIEATNLSSDEMVPFDLPLGTAPVEASLELPAPGEYRLVVDALDSGGVVLSRGETTVALSLGANQANVVLKAMPRLYITNMGDNTVTVYNGLEESLRTVIPTASQPAAIAANPLTRKLYIAHYVQDVSVIDARDERVAATISCVPTPTIPCFPAIAVNPVTNRFYVAWEYEDVIVKVFDGASQTVSTIITTNSNYPGSIAVNPVTNIIYFLCWGGSNIEVWDGNNNTRLSSVVGLSGSERYGMAVNPATNRAYASDGGAPANIDVLEGDAYVGSVPVGSCVSGGNAMLAVNSRTNRIYAVNSADNTVSVIDGGTNTVVQTIAVGTSPCGIAVSETLNKVYVVNTADGTVSVIDGESNAVSNTLMVGSSPQTIAILE